MQAARRAEHFAQDNRLTDAAAKPVKMHGKLVARTLPKPPVTVAAQQEIQGARDWIRQAEPSIKEIEARAEVGERAKTAAIR